MLGAIAPDGHRRGRRPGQRHAVELEGRAGRLRGDGQPRRAAPGDEHVERNEEQMHGRRRATEQNDQRQHPLRPARRHSDRDARGLVVDAGARCTRAEAPAAPGTAVATAAPRRTPRAAGAGRRRRASRAEPRGAGRWCVLAAPGRAPGARVARSPPPADFPTAATSPGAAAGRAGSGAGCAGATAATRPAAWGTAWLRGGVGRGARPAAGWWAAAASAARARAGGGGVCWRIPRRGHRRLAARPRAGERRRVLRRPPFGARPREVRCLAACARGIVASASRASGPDWPPAVAASARGRAPAPSASCRAGARAAAACSASASRCRVVDGRRRRRRGRQGVGRIGDARGAAARAAG